MSVCLSICMCVCSRNILDTQNASYLKSCRYNSRSSDDSLCPVFVLGDIVREAQTATDNSFDSVALWVLTPLSLSLCLCLSVCLCCWSH